MLVVLGQGWRGDAAAELYRIDVRGALPVNAARAPRVVIPFATEPRKTALGSLAVDPRSGDLFLGEENGNRIYRLGSNQHLRPVAVGLNHLLGGSTMALDRLGRLIFIDYASPETHLRAESPLPPSLSWLTEEGYRGPVVFRVDVHEDRPLPRRADLLPPIFPREHQERELALAVHAHTLPTPRPSARFPAPPIEATRADHPTGTVGWSRRPDTDRASRAACARRPAGHYHRTNLATGSDGSVFVCGGFHIRQIFRISPAGEVTIVASELGDPGGIVIDDTGALYVAETALHRIIRIVPAGRR